MKRGMRATRPLFSIDPGWLFVAAGVAMIVATVLIPPQMQLHGMREKLAILEAGEAVAIERLRAHADFLTAIEEEDPVLTRRLAAAQLNAVRASEVPVLVAASASAPVTAWIDATVPRPEVAQTPYPESHLVRLVTGRHRHWVLAATCICLFVGLILGPDRTYRRRDRAKA